MYLFNGTLPKRSKGVWKYWAGIAIACVQGIMQGIIFGW